VPSKVLLETPYPTELPTVPSCRSCNESYSLDEEYVACFLECVVAGSVQNAMNSRPKVAKTLDRKPPLARRLELAGTETADGVQWTTGDRSHPKCSC